MIISSVSCNSVLGTLTLGLRLGLFQLSLGILGVLILGLLNRLLI